MRLAADSKAYIAHRFNDRAACLIVEGEGDWNRTAYSLSRSLTAEKWEAARGAVVLPRGPMLMPDLGRAIAALAPLSGLRRHCEGVTTYACAAAVGKGCANV